MRYRYGNPVSSVPSRFISEIDEELIRKSGKTPEDVPEKIKPEIGPDDVKWIKIPDKKKMEPRTVSKNGKYKAGQLVVHAVFGEGKIAQVLGFDSDLKLIVDFSSVGRKTLMAQYANLIIK